MIIKSYEVKNKKLDLFNVYLLYAENSGLKKDIIQTITLLKEKNNFKYKKIEFDAEEILKNQNNFYNLIFSGSLFDEKKIIIVNRADDKLIEIIDDIASKKIEDTLIFFKADKLEKKSKIRNLFEKNKNLVCIACYQDNIFDLRKIIDNELKESNIKISSESISLLIERSIGDRNNLRNEIEKLKKYSINKKTISHDEIKQLSNMTENYQNDYIVNACLSGEKTKLKKVLDENIFLIEEFFLLFKTLSKKIHRLINIKKIYQNENNMDKVFLMIKPPIFWKEKDEVKKQINLWNEQKLNIIVKKMNEVELHCKKNHELAMNIILDFLSGICEEANNYS